MLLVKVRRNFSSIISAVVYRPHLVISDMANFIRAFASFRPAAQNYMIYVGKEYGHEYEVGCVTVGTTRSERIDDDKYIHDTFRTKHRTIGTIR